MSINSIHQATPPLHSAFQHGGGASISSEEKSKYIGIIREHLSEDKGVYSQKDLKLFDFSLNAALPSMFNILTSPYYIVTNMAKLIKNKLDNRKKDLTETNLKISTHLINFINSCITPLLYLSYFGISIFEASIFVPFVFATAALSALLNITSSIHSIFSIKKFMQTHKTGIFSNISEIYLAEDYKKISKKLPRILSQAKQLVEISPSLIEARDELKLDPKNQAKIGALFKEMKDLEQQLILNLFQKIENKYFTISEDFKIEIEKEFELKSSHVGEDKACEVCIKKIKKEHQIKKSTLATELRPVITQKFIASYKNIVEKLKSNEASFKEEGLDLGRKMIGEFQRALALKKKIQITNIALSVLGLVGTLVSSFAHAPIFGVGIIIGISFMIYYINHIRIHGDLDRQNEKFDWKNCFPNWLTSRLSHLSLSKSCHSPSKE